ARRAGAHDDRAAARLSARGRAHARFLRHRGAHEPEPGARIGLGGLRRGLARARRNAPVAEHHGYGFDFSTGPYRRTAAREGCPGSLKSIPVSCVTSTLSAIALPHPRSAPAGYAASAAATTGRAFRPPVSRSA